MNYLIKKMSTGILSYRHFYLYSPVKHRNLSKVFLKPRNLLIKFNIAQNEKKQSFITAY